MKAAPSVRTIWLRQIAIVAITLTAVGLAAWRLYAVSAETETEDRPDEPVGAVVLHNEQSATTTVAAPEVEWVEPNTFVGQNEVVLCQYGAPCSTCAADACGSGVGRPLLGVQCPDGNCTGREPRWNASRPIPFDIYGQGEYVGPHRSPHLGEYRLRVDDQVQFVYRLTREQSKTAYELNVGDTIRVESLTDEKLDRELIVQPDGTITVQLLGQIQAARMTLAELREKLEEGYKQYYNVPAIAVTPILVNTRLEDLRATVDARAGAGGQFFTSTVTPAGNLQLPAIGTVPAQGFTLEELKEEVDARYAEIVAGIEVQPVLAARAPRFIYVVGEVVQPGRFELVAPTSVMQAIALGGGWNNGGNLREVVVFRRDDNWRMMATRLDIRGALIGKRPCPADEIWLRDSDIVVVPKSAILRTDDFIELVFTRGIYGVLPFQGVSLNFAKASTI